MISVIVATANRGPDLAHMLATLRACVPPARQAWELLVVDNNSLDGTGAVLDGAAREGSLPLRPMFEGRRGKSYALNTALLASRGDVVAFTDDDAIVDRGWLLAVERAAARHRTVGAFGGRVLPAAAEPLPLWLTGGRPYRRTNGGVVAFDLGDEEQDLTCAPACPIGANVFYPRSVFERYGLFRQDLGPGSAVKRGEDYEFIFRLRAAGERILYVPDVVVSHPVDGARLRRRYCLGWNVWVGRSLARMRGRPPLARVMGGVPLYLVRALGRDLGRFAATAVRGNAFERFSALQEVAGTLGMIYETARLPRPFDASAQVRPWPADLTPRADQLRGVGRGATPVAENGARPPGPRRAQR